MPTQICHLYSLYNRAKGGELQSVLDRDEIPEEGDVIRFLRQVLGGLSFLHQFDIAHLDLKVFKFYSHLLLSFTFKKNYSCTKSFSVASKFTINGAISRL
jgi:serine/threonine protein kinase